MKPSDKIILQRVLKKAQRTSSPGMDNIIGFYKTVVELERNKEPDITEYYSYPLHFKDEDSDIVLIDIPGNADFTKAFIDNKDRTYPKDLFIGLPVTRKGKGGQIIVFNATIEFNDLKDYDPGKYPLAVRLSSLSLDRRLIEDLQLSCEQCEEIEEEIAEATNIADLQDLVKRQLGEDADLKLELQLALSSKNIALSQISSELNRLSASLVGRNKLLCYFLSHSPFDNLVEHVPVDELISVTPLDDSQASVVAHALSNRFSVVTGAPGTGKTQVILNIIANALLKDKTVLVASKNNKAVDNVKDKFDAIDQSGYLLRFGRKECINTQTIPAISRIIQRLGSLQSKYSDFQSLLSLHQSLINTIRSARKQLEKIESCEKEISVIGNSVSETKDYIQKEKQRHKSAVTDIKARYNDIDLLENISYESINRQLSVFRRRRNHLQRKYSGLSGVWHNLFSKKKDAENLLFLIEDLPSSIKTGWRQLGIKDSVDDFQNGKEIIWQASLIIPLLEKVADYLLHVGRESRVYSSNIAQLNARLQDLEKKRSVVANELGQLAPKRMDYVDQIARAKDTLLSTGIRLVEAKINSVECCQDASNKISSYISYLPNNHSNKALLGAPFVSLAKTFLSICRLISTTSLSIKSAFPLTDQLFDILIIDEASQCDVASALPLILRAKQVVIIGDPLQLKHITSVKIEEENCIRDFFGLSQQTYLKYVGQSLWDFSRDFLALARQNNFPLTLENHYRCHHDIIGYSNRQFYGRFLDRPLVVKTDESAMKLPRKGITMIDVHGLHDGEQININRVEAHRCIQIAKELCSLKADVSIGIVTPFRDQADYIKKNLPDEIKGNIAVNTAHGFQGDEKDAMIYSLVVTDNSPASKINWIDYHVPNLVNVAVTRARQTLFVVGNAGYVKRHSPAENALGSLVRYAQSKM